MTLRTRGQRAALDETATDCGWADWTLQRASSLRPFALTGRTLANVLHQKQVPGHKVRYRDRTVGCSSTKETDHGTRSTPSY